MGEGLSPSRRRVAAPQGEGFSHTLICEERVSKDMS